MTTTTCAKCGTSAPEGPRPVRERVPGKAGQYRLKPVVWCGRCRAVHMGKWKHAA